ncbi:MAG: glycerophosphodiester phosphodiesterase [Prevotellaceae bacterium]|nr:glycerophosphodiester phosphodiesterase [Prevotellaceae bacterium]
MKWKKWMTVCVLCAVCMACSSDEFLLAQTRVIAHRGYWKCDGSAQNSITSMNRAAEIGVYGSEFDVQMTADKMLVINHDDSIAGRAICDTEYAELKTYQLANGETLPTLDDYLNAGKALPDIQLILEIKSQHTQALNEELTQLVVEKVKAMQMEGQVEYISFSLHVCEVLTTLTPGSRIAYLNGDLSPQELSAKGINGIDYQYNVLLDKPEWITEAHALGMGVNTWTVNDTKQMKKLGNLGVDYLTTDYPAEALKLVE